MSSSASAAFAAGSNGDSDGTIIIGAGALSLEDILCRARASLDPTATTTTTAEGAGGGSSGDERGGGNEGKHLLLSGDGRHLGSDVSWKILLGNLEGKGSGSQLAFREDVGGENLSFSWGYRGDERGEGDEGGVPSSPPPATSWEVDDRGVAKELELDDHEALLIAAAVRSGWWASEEAGALLERTLLPRRGPGAPPALRLRLLRGGLLPPEGGAAPLPSEASDTGGGGVGGGGSVEATLTLVDDASCLPLELATPLCGGRERWRFEGWARWPGARGRAFPARTTHAAPSGGENEFVLRSASEVDAGGGAGEGGAAAVPPASAGGGRRAVVAGAGGAAAAAAAAAAPSPFSCPFPTDSLRPAGATYSSPNPHASSLSSSACNDVPAWLSSSGHLLVRPLIDGVPAPGLFLVDSGASGLVIEREAAESLGLRAFGELFVAGVAGAVRSRFRRAASLSLGPVELSSPLFMELPVAGVVTGGPAGGASMRTVGILGHDLFRAAVVTLPRPAGGSGRSGGSGGKGSGSARSSGAAIATRLRLDDPAAFEAPASAEGRWCDLRFVSNLPHVMATMPAVSCEPGNEEEEEDTAGSGTSGSRKRKKRFPSRRAGGGAREGGGGAGGGGEGAAGREHSIMLMVDSGAGGADVMFHSRAAGELGLLEGGGGPPKSTARVVRGVGTGSTSSGAPSSSSPSSSSSSAQSHLAITATSGSLPWLTLGPVATFGRVRTLAFSPPGGLDLSAYSQGIACADLLSRARVVLDYPRRRMALIPVPAAAGSVAGSAGVDARAPRRGVPPGKGA